MKIIYSQNKESGVVSILSVIFFIILMSIMAVSFLRIVTDEQQQVIQDDLGRGALAAAQSGVEDAKRALLRCRSLSGAQQTACYATINQPTCPGMFGGVTNQLRSDLGLEPNRQPDGSIKVGDPSNNNNQRYTCVTMSQDTSDYEGIFDLNLGNFIPLRSTGVFNQVRISWHKTSLDGGVGVAALPNPGSPISNDANPRQPEWQSAAGVGYIAMPRVQLVQFNPSQTLNAQENSTVGAFLVPSLSGLSTVNVGAMNSTGINPKRAVVNCNGAQQGFMCTATFNLNFSKPLGAQYFMLLKSQYRSAHYKVELLNTGTPTSFNDVQPQVDSTGAVGNVFKRVLSRIEYQADTFFTSNAIESGLSICKNFFVTISEFNNDQCVSALPSGAVPSSSAGVGDAEIGSYCAIKVCVPGDNGGAISWDVAIANISRNDPTNVLSCTWDFGDRSPNSTTNCNYGDLFVHSFPKKPEFLTNPNLTRDEYTVTLTVNLRSGGTSVATKVFRLPQNYP